MSDNPKLLIVVAHPDDAEYLAGGTAAIYRRLGRPVKIVSVTDGSAGHHQLPPDELKKCRRREASAAGAVISAVYETWDYPDGSLTPSLEVRERIIREIREQQPDLVLTHRTCDYHPDHRAVGQCVQDASYMVTVPHVVGDVPALRRDPVVAYLPDLFRRPAPIRPDVIIDVTGELGTIVDMLACHRSQVFEWLPHQAGILDAVPEDADERRQWLQSWFADRLRKRAERFREELVTRMGEPQGRQVEFIEMFEISEYGRQPSPERLRLLFPMASC